MKKGGLKAKELSNKVPLFSIITVVYNGADHLENTILSLLNQSYKNFEFIIIDGGSSDGTLEVVKKYDNKIDIWISEPDNGIYDAMNKGLSYSVGEWVYFLNCGDCFYSESILEDVGRHLSNEDYSVFAGKVQVDDRGQLYPKDNFKSSLTARKLFASKFSHQALFVKRDAYIKHGGFNLRYKVFADFDLVYKIVSFESGWRSSHIVIAHFDLSGISSNWRYTMSHFKEIELILSSNGESESFLVFGFRLMKAYFYYFRMSIQSFLK